jgi:triphosphoribosyl-dephospho-CoA synthase
MMSLLSNAVRVTPRNLSSGTQAARRLARLARQALIAEAELTPKPGLVDRRGNGSHSDLSLEIMRRSAVAIEPYFRQMALASWSLEPSQSIREQLALIGRQAERAMLEATGGSNAHKGAIWALGLLVAASAMEHNGRDNRSANRSSDHVAANTHGSRNDDVTASAVAANASANANANGSRNRHITASTVATTAKVIAAFEDRAIPRLVSHGDTVAKRYGVAGARGEALSGFPHVLDVALPSLRRKRRRGASEQIARLDALLSIMSSLDDTCLLYRGGQPALAAAKEGAAAIAAAGGTATALGRERLHHLDRRLLDLRVSPGGSADLLAAALFLDAVERQLNDIQADLGPELSLTEVSHGAH